MIHKIDFENIKKAIVKAVQPDEVYIFGSYAHGEPNEHSDIDIAVVKKGVRKLDDQFKHIDKIRAQLQFINTAMDILIFNKHKFNKRKNIFGSVQYEIYHKGLKIYEKR